MSHRWLTGSIARKLLAMLVLPIGAAVLLTIIGIHYGRQAEALHRDSQRWTEHVVKLKSVQLAASRYEDAIVSYLWLDAGEARGRAEGLSRDLIAAGEESLLLGREASPEHAGQDERVVGLLEKLADRGAAAIALNGAGQGAAAHELHRREVHPLLHGELEPVLAAMMDHDLAQAARAKAAASAMADRRLPAAALVLLVSVLLVLVPSLLFARGLRRDIFELKEGAARVARHEFGVPVVVESDDELRSLAAAHNEMSRELVARREGELAVASADARIRALEEARGELQAVVDERTAELRRANAQLEHSLQQLREAQSKLVTSERLAAIGTLAAGVAHEINNPLAYVTSNIRFVLDELPPVCETPHSDRTTDAARELRQDLADALKEGIEGALRVEQIVRDLKLLSRADNDVLADVDLQQVLDSALNIATNQFKHRARLVRDFHPLPPVVGNQGRLGQVFLNLIVNAAQSMALEKAATNELRVTTRTDARGQAVVEIRDSGCGIPETIRQRIFEPFFTTKPEGVGTGLGLSICHGIVTRLKGSIEVESAVGKGSLFRVILPGRSAPQEAEPLERAPAA